MVCVPVSRVGLELRASVMMILTRVSIQSQGSRATIREVASVESATVSRLTSETFAATVQ